MGYAENYSHACYYIWNSVSHKITDSCDVIWLHRMYYQDDNIANMTMNVYEISKGKIEAMRLDGLTVHEPGRVDLVHDETEVESATSDDEDGELSNLKVESEAREGENDDAVTEASDSNTEQVSKTYSGRVVHMPEKYDGFKMTAAEI